LKGKPMENTERSLRFMVEKWLLLAPALSARVTRGIRAGANQRPYICVEASLSTGAFALYLFRQGDGTWDVFPPDVDRPVIRVF
jgi:hypothetical protein